jgi:hypothetical protein
MQLREAPTDQVQVNVSLEVVDPAGYRKMRYLVSGTWPLISVARAKVRLTCPLVTVAVGALPAGMLSVRAVALPFPRLDQ